MMRFVAVQAEWLGSRPVGSPSPKSATTQKRGRRHMYGKARDALAGVHETAVATAGGTGDEIRIDRPQLRRHVFK